MNHRFNRGEWSEIYVACELIGSGEILKSGDGMIKIVAVKSVRGNFEAKICDDGFARLNGGTQKIKKADFLRASEIILRGILSYSGGNGSFEIPEVNNFLIQSGILKVRAGNKTRSDLCLEGFFTGNNLEEKSFSIKSFFGSNPTILNVSKKSGIKFMLSDNPGEETVKKLMGIKSPKELVREIIAGGLKLVYSGFVEKVFEENLKFIDSSFPETFAYSLVVYYSGTGGDITDIINSMSAGDQRTAACYKTDIEDKYLKDRFSRLLLDVTSGMTTAVEWNGNYDVRGGYIIVTDSQIACVIQDDIQALKDYLLKHSYFDTPSMARYDFGFLYRLENKYYVNLIAQIRLRP